jgi:uncharacterized protein YndB with AHSA1/START domain
MSEAAHRPGDRARASVLVRVPPAEAFRLFTEELDQWWRRGPAYRLATEHPSRLSLEPRVGGRLLETLGERVETRATVTRWEPPRHLSLEWRAANFSAQERTFVEVEFEPRGKGTFVTVTHHGWSAIRPDHPVRHGEAAADFVGRMGLWWGELLSALRAHALPPS